MTIWATSCGAAQQEAVFKRTVQLLGPPTGAQTEWWIGTDKLTTYNELKSLSLVVNGHRVLTRSNAYGGFGLDFPRTALRFFEVGAERDRGACRAAGPSEGQDALQRHRAEARHRDLGEDPPRLRHRPPRRRPAEQAGGSAGHVRHRRPVREERGPRRGAQRRARGLLRRQPADLRRARRRLGRRRPERPAGRTDLSRDGRRSALPDRPARSGAELPRPREGAVDAARRPSRTGITTAARSPSSSAPTRPTRRAPTTARATTSSCARTPRRSPSARTPRSRRRNTLFTSRTIHSFVGYVGPIAPRRPALLFAPRSARRPRASARAREHAARRPQRHEPDASP